jgi:hypothetical protein
LVYRFFEKNERQSIRVIPNKVRNPSSLSPFAHPPHLSIQILRVLCDTSAPSSLNPFSKFSPQRSLQAQRASCYLISDI